MPAARPIWRLMSRRLVLALASGLALSATLSSALSCSYSPDFANDTLQCSATGACPKGYSCASDQRCWKDGGGNGGGGSGGGGDARLNNFVGTWDFASGSLDGACTDGSVVHRVLDSGDFIIVTLGNGGILLQYYCDTGWSLHLPAGSTTATASTGQNCVDRVTDSTSGIITTYTWSIVDLSFGTSDGKSATTIGHLKSSFSGSDNVNGTCTVAFTGPLTKV